LALEVGNGQAEVNRLEDALQESKDSVQRLLSENISLQTTKTDLHRINSDFADILNGSATKIQLIRFYRNITGEGLRQSKEGIENSEFYRRWCMVE